jgi:hypothetical protein
MIFTACWSCFRLNNNDFECGLIQSISGSSILAQSGSAYGSTKSLNPDLMTIRIRKFLNSNFKVKGYHWSVVSFGYKNDKNGAKKFRFSTFSYPWIRISDPQNHWIWIQSGSGPTTLLLTLSVRKRQANFRPSIQDLHGQSRQILNYCD